MILQDAGYPARGLSYGAPGILETPVTATPMQVTVDGWNAAPITLPVHE